VLLILLLLRLVWVLGVLWIFLQERGVGVHLLLLLKLLWLDLLVAVALPVAAREPILLRRVAVFLAAAHRSTKLRVLLYQPVVNFDSEVI